MIALHFQKNSDYHFTTAFLLPPIFEINGTWRVWWSQRDQQLRVHQPLLTSVHMNKCLCMCLHVRELKDVRLRASLEALFGGVDVFFACARVCVASTCWHRTLQGRCGGSILSSFSPLSNFLFKMSPSTAIIFPLLFTPLSSWESQIKSKCKVGKISATKIFYIIFT